ncbi:MAG: dihydroneopterin aldolase family protein [Phycisphaeraceae bacterium]|nr:dihydroneopterin aldolase family protein [Phycisphaeraceae bacterium]
MDPTDAETACFEAGIKFGSLYHQFAGTPVSPASADSLARAMEAAIENQPHCTDVTVSMDRTAIATAAGDHGYTELSGRFMDVEVRVERAGISVVSEMSMTDGYPLMQVVSVED